MMGFDYGNKSGNGDFRKVKRDGQVSGVGEGRGQREWWLT